MGLMARFAALLRVMRRKKRPMETLRLLRRRLALDLAVAMARTPAEIPSELAGRLRRHFSEAELVELAAGIAWENYRARFNRVFGVQPAGFSEGAFCALPERHGVNA